MNQKFFTINLVLFLHFYNISLIFGQDECEENARQHIKYVNQDRYNLTRTIFYNFNSFSSLFPISSSCNFTFNITNFLTFIPNLSNLILDEQFALKRFIRSSQMNSLQFMQLFNIRGINIALKPIHPQLQHLTSRIKMEIYSSHFDFYSLDNKRLTECRPNEYASLNFTSVNFFNSFYGINFVNTVYPKQWCPYAFINSKIAHLIFADVANSFLKQNRLNFLHLNQSIINLEMKLLEQITFNLQYEILDYHMLNSNLFLKVKMIRINGVLNGIQAELFKQFKSLKNLDIQIDNFKEFFHSGTEWITHLNSGSTKSFNLEKSANLSLSEIKANKFFIRFLYRKEMISFDPLYDYPDEDICLFEKFPHHHLVYAILVPGKMLECTCTLKWLEYYSVLYKRIISLVNDYSHFYDSQLVTNKINTFLFCMEDKRDCQFETKFNRCQIIGISNGDSIFKVIHFVLIFINS